jgi:hypothetical protein
VIRPFLCISCHSPLGYCYACLWRWSERSLLLAMFVVLLRTARIYSCRILSISRGLFSFCPSKFNLRSVLDRVLCPPFVRSTCGNVVTLSLTCTTRSMIVGSAALDPGVLSMNSVVVGLGTLGPSMSMASHQLTYSPFGLLSSKSIVSRCLPTLLTLPVRPKFEP